MKHEWKASQFPSPAEEYLDNPLDLNQYLVSKPAATFFIRAQNSQMKSSGIYPGDLLIVDRSLTPKSGQTIIATLSGEWALGTFIKRGGLVSLHCDHGVLFSGTSENSSLDIWGVVTYCVHILK